MYRLMDLLSNSTIAYKEIYFDNHEKLLGHESAFVKLLSASNKQLMMPYLFFILCRVLSSECTYWQWTPILQDTFFAK